MLVNYSNPGGNIKNDGWILTKDENNNIIPYNYNQKAGIDLTINQTYSWEITAPAIDNIYYIVAEARYGSNRSDIPFYNYSIISSLLPLVVDGTPPSVTSNTNNLYVKTGTYLTLNATITDALADVKYATVNVSEVNSTINEAILTLTGPYWLNSTIMADKGNTNGLKNLTITAYDNANNINNGINMTAGIDNDPPAVISNTNNLISPNGSFLTLNTTIIDTFPGVNNATVNVSAINSTINEAILTLTEGYWVNTTITADRGQSTQFMNLSITAYDYSGNVNNSINMTVWIEPELTITDWSNNRTNDRSADITIFINESVLFNVTANQTGTYNWTYDGIDQLHDFDNFSKNFIESGLHYINTTISSSIDHDHRNWTINVIYKPDLVMVPGNISFSYIPSENENGEVKESVNVTINATVYNSGLGDASNVNVSFYDGPPDTGINIANATITNISAGESQNATIYWNSIIGTHNISIKTDPENTLVETDDSNNNASKNINVSAWQKYYGNISGNITLGGNTGSSLINWKWDTNQGNVFVSNIAYFDFNNLQALGRKKNGEIAQDDFQRADELLNMTSGSSNATGFINNNITQLFSLNGTAPRNVTSFTVYGRTIDQVAIVNSTNTINHESVESSTFITGILWDTAKDDGDGDYGDDGEELVFITGINVGTWGIVNSSHNYETGIPSKIKNEGNVYFFVELK